MDAPAPRKAALGFIFVALVLMVLGFSIIIPVLPGLVTKFEGNDVARGSHYYAWLLGIFGAVQFVASPILGSLSDRFGRRRVILIALAGTAVDYVVMGLAPSMGWLFAARIVSGATAGLLAACYAYIADVTPPEKRAAGFGLVGAAFGLGFVLGPLIGGYLGDISLQLPFFAAAVIVALNWVYGAFVLPESLSLENRRPFSWRRANPVGYGSAAQGWMIYCLVLLGAWGGIAGPAAQALITKHVPANEQGALQGSLSGLTSLTTVFAPFLAAWSFGNCIGPGARFQIPGIAFYEASALMLIALALALRSFHLDDQVGAAAPAPLSGLPGPTTP